jgi:formylglycine-generating enzyme required for sulfatase activity
MREMKASAARVYAKFSLLTVAGVVALAFGTAAPAAAQAQTKVNPKDGLTYVMIPPGTFLLGCSQDDSACEPNEKPARSVTITKGFWMGQSPVTQGAFMKVMGSNPSHFKGDDKLPVEKVDWTNAGRYCQQVDMRLPTEAEWEYAARGGKPGARYGELDAITWYSKNATGKTHAVGGKQPNAYGLHDMLGNVWQWVADQYGSYDGAAATDPKGPADSWLASHADWLRFRVLRGGSWINDASLVRVSSRNYVETSYRADYIGFRCASN